MFNHLKSNKILWSISTCLTLLAALAGIINPDIYTPVFDPQFISGALPQDILTLIVSILALITIHSLKRNSLKRQIIIFGIIGSFAYLYGIFVIERVYNIFYLLYLAVFASSCWSLVYSLTTINHKLVDQLTLSIKQTRISSIIGLVIATLFTLLWVAALIPLTQLHQRIEYLYSIYILDLCFVMPAFFITSILSLKKNGVGIALLPAVFIVGFFVIFPLGLGELVKPYYHQIPDLNSATVSLLFSFLMLIVAAIHLIKIKHPI